MNLQNLTEEQFGAGVLGAFEEVFGCSLLDDAAMLEHDHAIGAPHGAQAMCDDQRRAIAQEVLHRRLDRRMVLHRWNAEPVLVRQAAQKTDSKQTSKTLLLSDDAYMNSQPALEIYADDVKCTHGSTTGPVDEDMVFYLRTRGVGLEAARHLLTYAFAADITRRIKVEKVRSRLEDFMAAQAGLPQDLRITDLGEANEQHRT